jgi:S1-C subfamily serine protease
VLGQDIVTGGDVIVALDGRPIENADALVRLVTNTLAPGARVTLTVVRGGRRRAFPLTLAARPTR